MTCSTSLVQTLDKLQPISFIKIPAGEFWMGSPAEEKYRYDNEGPQRLVKLKSFFLGQTPVTHAQWRVVARWPKIQIELDPDTSHFWGPNRPVQRVSWEEAMEFCQRLKQYANSEYNYTLPSEAQWEYACRAGTTTPFAFGETLRPDMASYSSVKGIYREESTDVRSFPANAWGLYDMHGNVWEWCADQWHHTYDNAPTDGSPWIDSSDNYLLRVARGGSWFSNSSDCRSACRIRRRQNNCGGNIGFRICAPCHD